VVGVGSDTSEVLFDELAREYNRDVRHRNRRRHEKRPRRLASWWATGPSPIRTKAGCRPIERPNGSSPGIAALAQRQVLPDGRPCIDFARSLAPRSPGAPANSVFLPFALDGLTWAANAGSAAPSSLTVAQLKAIIEWTSTRWDQVGGTSGETIQPFLPERGPGLLGLLNHLAGVERIGPCVQTVQQDQGTDPKLRRNPNALVFYSIGKYLAQTVYHQADVHGKLELGRIDGAKPTVLNRATGRIEINVGQVPGVATFPEIFRVLEYVVVLSDGDGRIDPALERLFVGAGSWLCADAEAREGVQDHGFLLLAPDRCGRPE